MAGIEQLLSLAKKAGRIQSGEYGVENSVKCGAAHLVILAGDASANTKKKFRNMCSFYEIQLTEYGSREKLGQCIGAALRSVIAVEDEGFARAMQKALPASAAKGAPGKE